MHYDNRKKNKTKTLQRRSARQFKYDGLIEYGVDLLIERSEYACVVAEVRGGIR